MSEELVRHAGDVLIGGVNYTRRSGQEVAGWCWRDKATGQLACVAQAHRGNSNGVVVDLPVDPDGSSDIACSWHTHPWGARVAPGPSRQDLRNSELAWVSDMPHFVLDQHGLWQYSRGRIVKMCPWNHGGTGLEMDRCRS